MQYAQPSCCTRFGCCSFPPITACVVGTCSASSRVLSPRLTSFKHCCAMLCRHVVAVPPKRSLWLHVQGRAILCCQLLLTFAALSEAAPRLFKVPTLCRTARLQMHHTAAVSCCRVVGLPDCLLSFSCLSQSFVPLLLDDSLVSAQVSTDSTPLCCLTGPIT